VIATYRWEWRTFARSPAYAGLLPPHQTDKSVAVREHYILSVASPNIVKIRDGCLDIKTLVGVDVAGLQQWRPLLTEPFPINEATLDAAWVAWGIPAPVMAHWHCTLDEFLSEIVANEKSLCRVETEKKRSRFAVQGCPGEYVIVTVGAETWESIAFENLDPFRVWRAVETLGLENVENTSYSAGLKKIVGLNSAEQSRKTEGE
jgi:exopolyphosphatase/guanosine-5'-triphosphate,3'-diphosphate pyrophosphatase